MSSQLDLFAVPLSIAPPISIERGPDLARLLPARTLAWDKLLNRSRLADQVTIFASHRWTGIVVEQLCDPTIGNFLLHADGVIQDVSPWSGFPGRTVLMAPDLALKLHRQAPLIMTGARGTDACRYRFARPGEAAPAELELPEAYCG